MNGEAKAPAFSRKSFSFGLSLLAAVAFFDARPAAAQSLNFGPLQFNLGGGGGAAAIIVTTAAITGGIILIGMAIAITGGIILIGMAIAITAAVMGIMAAVRRSRPSDRLRCLPPARA